MALLRHRSIRASWRSRAPSAGRSPASSSRGCARPTTTALPTNH